MRTLRDCLGQRTHIERPLGSNEQNALHDPQRRPRPNPHTVTDMRLRETPYRPLASLPMPTTIPAQSNVTMEPDPRRLSNGRAEIEAVTEPRGLALSVDADIELRKLAQWSTRKA